VTERRTLARLLRPPAPGLDHPTLISFTPDGGAITFLQSADATNVRSLWRLDLSTSERELLVVGHAPPRGGGSGDAAENGAEEALPLEEQLRRQRARETALGVTRYVRATAADTVVVPVDGRLLVSVAGGQGELVPGVDGVQAVAIAPDGSRLAYVRAGNVHALATGSAGQGAALTSDAADGTTNGLPDFAAAEELDRHEGLWWSGDGQALAWARVDERSVPRYALARLTDGRIHVELHRYPFAGGPNARVRLQVASFTGSTTSGGLLPPAGGPVEVDLGMADDDYLARVVPHPAGGWLVAVLPRAQRTLRWWRVLGDGGTHPLWEESSEPWLNLDDDTRILGDGSVLRTTERTGFRQAELRPPGAEAHLLTGGDWVVTSVAGVNEGRAEVYVLGTADGPLERHLYAVPLDAPRPVERPARLTQERGWHGAVFSADGERWIDTWSTRTEAPAVVARWRNAERVVPVHAPSASAETLGLPVPDFLELRAADSATLLHGALFRPSSRTVGPGPDGALPATRTPAPPLVVWVYGGPHSQNVREAWELTIHPSRQGLAQAGFAVLVVDNRGTANRGLAFEAAIAGTLGVVEVADQAAVVEQLVALGEADGGRVGITGGSYGGYMTIRCMELRPDLFRAGVALAPVTDWRGYDTAYTERYLGLPGANPAGYRASSSIPDAGRLRGKLRIVHGELDENVNPWHSARMVAALVAAGRDPLLATVAGERHRYRNVVALSRRERDTLRHLQQALARAVPAKELPAATRPPGVRPPRRGG
jgi:dipeptidyl-peptidase-4